MNYCKKCFLPFLDRGEGLCTCEKPEWIELPDIRRNAKYVMNKNINKYKTDMVVK